MKVHLQCLYVWVNKRMSWPCRDIIAKVYNKHLDKPQDQSGDLLLKRSIPVTWHRYRAGPSVMYTVRTASFKDTLVTGAQQGNPRPVHQHRISRCTFTRVKHPDYFMTCSLITVRDIISDFFLVHITLCFNTKQTAFLHRFIYTEHRRNLT